MFKKFASGFKVNASNWRTFLCGLGSLLSAAGEFLSVSFDEDPLTQPNYIFISSMVLAGLGLIFARDATKPAE